MKINILTKVMIKNDAEASDNRKLFLKNGVFTLNMISSPGAGKTTLLENLLPILKMKYRIGIIEGDLFTSRDAERLTKFEIPITQINTEGGCHLDARMINRALENFDLAGLDLIIIENVGNLVCPTGFDLGEHSRVLVYSIAEGEDKPQKYSPMFKTANCILINKIDLAPICKIDLSKIEQEVKSVNSHSKQFNISAIDGNTLTEFAGWLSDEIERYKKA